jgi:hypothetical protein
LILPVLVCKTDQNRTLPVWKCKKNKSVHTHFSVFCDGSVGLSKNWVPKIDELPAFFPTLMAMGRSQKELQWGNAPRV